MEQKHKKRFVKVRLGQECRYIEEADTLLQFTQNFKNEFRINNNSKKEFILSCKNKANRITKVEDENTYQKLKNLIIEYPKLIEPSFIPKPKKKSEIVIHNNSKCSQCGESPIRGIKYKCLNCPSYELCPSCEKRVGEKHGHPLLMLRRSDDLEKFGKDILEKNKQHKEDLEIKKDNEEEKEDKEDIGDKMDKED